MTKVAEVLRFRVDNNYLVKKSFNPQMGPEDKSLVFLDPAGQQRPEVFYPILCSELENSGWEPVCERPEFVVDQPNVSNYFLVIYKRHSTEHPTQHSKN